MRSQETEREAELIRHRELAVHHRRLAEKLCSAGYHDLARGHLLEAKLEELTARAMAAVAE